MEILGVGGWELAAIFLIALVVAGPARMIRWAYQLGRFLGKLREVWSQAATTLQKELDDAGVDIRVPKDVPTRQTLRRDLNQMVKPFVDELRQPLDEVNNEMRRARLEGRSSTSPAQPPAAGTSPTHLGTWGASPSQQTGEGSGLLKTPPALGTWGQSPASDGVDKRETGEE
jgi:Sec-independent protein translocase protein TatA